MTRALAGPLALRIPASITAHAAHPSTLLLALAWIGAIYVALAIAVALLLVGSELMARVHAWRDRRTDGKRDTHEAVSSSRSVSASTRVSSDAEPIESYPEAPIGFGFSELAPPLPTIPTVTPLAPIAVLHAPMGCIPVLLNPMTNARMRIPE